MELKDPCVGCLVYPCCLKYCTNRVVYNHLTLTNYLNGTNIKQFDKIIDDVIRLCKQKYSHPRTLTREEIKQNIIDEFGQKEI